MKIPEAERVNAMDKIKAAGTAGVASYAITEVYTLSLLKMCEADYL
jgi:hypothetical protein